MGMVEVELITPPKLQSQFTCMRETSPRLSSGWGFPSTCSQDHTATPCFRRTASPVLTAYWPTNYSKKINLSLSLSRVTKPEVPKSFLKQSVKQWFPQQLQKCSLANSKATAGPPWMRISFKSSESSILEYFSPINFTSRFSSNHNKIMGTLS